MRTPARRRSRESAPPSTMRHVQGAMHERKRDGMRLGGRSLVDHFEHPPPFDRLRRYLRSLSAAARGIKRVATRAVRTAGNRMQGRAAPSRH